MSFSSDRGRIGLLGIDVGVSSQGLVTTISFSPPNGIIYEYESVRTGLGPSQVDRSVQIVGVQ